MLAGDLRSMNEGITMTFDELHIEEEILRCYAARTLSDTDKCPVDTKAGDDEVVGNLQQHPYLARLFLLLNELMQVDEAVVGEGQEKLTPKQSYLYGWTDTLSDMICLHLQGIFGPGDCEFEICSDWRVVRREMEVRTARVLVIELPG